jgi:hypothetical protein
MTYLTGNARLDDMALWLAMRDAIALVTPFEDIIMDGVPVPAGTFSTLAPAAVVSAMRGGGGGGGVLIASSTIPQGLPTQFTITVADAGSHWLLCDVATLKFVASANGGAATWSSAAERGTVLLFASDTPCHNDRPIGIVNYFMVGQQ